MFAESHSERSNHLIAGSLLIIQGNHPIHQDSLELLFQRYNGPEGLWDLLTIMFLSEYDCSFKCSINASFTAWEW
ncbi:MAG: hypothetical protein COA94_03700 [Rickettsiales bacterium]|nr:MAG: hypothetical protein COA94_03700 [Rickettsiales bacterium]